jgi:hypothetical protein
MYIVARSTLVDYFAFNSDQLSLYVVVVIDAEADRTNDRRPDCGSRFFRAALCRLSNAVYRFIRNLLTHPVGHDYCDTGALRCA